MTSPRSLVEQSLIDEDKLFSRQLQQICLMLTRCSFLLLQCLFFRILDIVN